MSDSDRDGWERYGTAMIGSMEEVLAHAQEEHHPVLLETADYWLSLGIAIGLNHQQDAMKLLNLIEANEENRGELEVEAETFLRDALA